MDAPIKKIYHSVSVALFVIQFALDNLSYTAESGNRLVAIGEWLISPMILERLKKELKYNIGNQITQKRTELNDDVRDIVVADAICLHNSIDTLDIKNIQVPST